MFAILAVSGLVGLEVLFVDTATLHCGSDWSCVYTDCRQPHYTVAVIGPVCVLFVDTATLPCGSDWSCVCTVCRHSHTTLWQCLAMCVYCLWTQLHYIVAVIGHVCVLFVDIATLHCGSDRPYV